MGGRVAVMAAGKRLEAAGRRGDKVDVDEVLDAEPRSGMGEVMKAIVLLLDVGVVGGDGRCEM